MADDWTPPAGDLMKGKRGIVMGVANQNSIAWGIARQLAAQGHRLGDGSRPALRSVCHVSHTLSRPDFCAITPFLQGSRSERNDELFEPLTAQAMTIITTNIYGIETAAAGDFDA